ncbi:hypothetical protein [Maribacter halichondriae]|uniref:hypothetical protein n=1 Tax=Maribacter halichondriae TaxID=2980554 RepID=UPI002359D9D9|nr:hypothetical protein [Maribacter sp. Hal144]
MKLFPLIVGLLMTTALVAQKSSMSDILWTEAGGYIDINKDNGGSYDIVDETKNGYLKIAFTEQGCGCYYETTIGAYKNSIGNFTTLKMDWDGCGSRKTLSSNKGLTPILPEDFGLQTFLPKSKETEYQITSAVFYLEAEIPRKGTDTRLNLSYIPFGIQMAPKNNILAYEYKQISEHGRTNFLYSYALKSMLRKISDENTAQCILERSIDDIVPEDKKLVEKLYGENKPFRGIDELAAQIHQLKTIYEIAKDIEYESVILGWDRDKARFYIREKIKNEASELSFLEFVRQLPFLMAVC